MTIHRHFVEVRARTAAHAATTTRKVSVMSGMFDRAMATIVGVSVSTRPATRPAVRPNTRRTIIIVNHTVAAPNNADGSSMVQLWKPNTRTITD